MNKKRKLQSRLLVTSIFLFVAGVVIITYLVAWIKDLERADFFSFRVGNFVYWSNSKEVDYKDRNGEIFQDKISTIDDKKVYENSFCSAVSGIHNLSLYKYIVPRPKLYGYWKNVISLKSWNSNLLKFANEKVKTYYLKEMEAFTNLEKYADNEKFIDLVLDNPNIGITVRPWMYGDGCGGWASIPIYSTKIIQNEYDTALYVEALEHQEVPLTSQPVRFLIVRKNNDWIIVEADGDINKQAFSADVENCKNIKDNTGQYKCVGKIYLTKYQNKDKNIAWVKKNLEAINYSPIN